MADMTVIRRDGDVWWWTWAGARANATSASALPRLADLDLNYDNQRIRLRSDLDPGSLEGAFGVAESLSALTPAVDAAAVRGLKFAEILPPGLAAATLGERLADRPGAAVVLGEGRRWVS